MGDRDTRSAAEIAADLEGKSAADTDADLFSDPRKPDEIEEGAEEAAKEEGEAEEEGEEPTEEAEPKKQEAPAKADEGKQPEKPAEGAKPEDEKPIQLPSGKTLSYDVLKEARVGKAKAAEEATAAKAEASEAKGRVSALEAEKAELLKQLEAAKKANGDATVATEEGDPLAGLDPDDYPPQLVKAITALNSRLQAAEAKATRADQRAADVESRASAPTPQATEAVQEAIDENDHLRAWQAAKSPLLWNAAKAADKELSNDQAWKNKSMAERFHEVTRRVCDENGLPLPPPFKPGTQSSAQNTNGAPAKTRPKAGTAPVASISDIPGGAAPAVDQHQSIEQSSTASLASRMSSMTNDQLESFLAE